MNLSCSFNSYQLNFKVPARTSRNVMQYKRGYFLTISDGTTKGIGECSFIEGLSIDNLKIYEQKLAEVCGAIESGKTLFELPLLDFPSISFGVEMAMQDYQTGGRYILYPSTFTEGIDGIPINGLVWMSDKEYMIQQIREKIESGYHCLKLKVGALSFDDELDVLKFIRQNFSSNTLEIRLDANGAFTASTALERLNRLSTFNIHSIEQPIAPGQCALMHELCINSPIAIALDEELIELSRSEQFHVLNQIKPHYIILKPSLVGGFAICDKWIQLASENKIGWWATSALETNIGLNAIAQWVFTKKSTMTQGLGTGSLYTNNIESPLHISNGSLFYNLNAKWGNAEP